MDTTEESWVAVAMKYQQAKEKAYIEEMKRITKERIQALIDAIGVEATFEWVEKEVLEAEHER